MTKQYIKTTKGHCEGLNGTQYYSDEAKTVLHREDGPAIEWANGDTEWYLNGERHRDDGPAVEWANGDRFWYIHGTIVHDNGDDEL